MMIVDHLSSPEEAIERYYNAKSLVVINHLKNVPKGQNKN
jgi:hypothetical protein